MTTSFDEYVKQAFERALRRAGMEPNVHEGPFGIDKVRFIALQGDPPKRNVVLVDLTETPA